MPFKIMLCPKAPGRGVMRGVGFRDVNGFGEVVLKCESQLPEGCGEVAFRIGVGRGSVLQDFKGPVVRSFLEHSCHSLPTDHAEWDFSASVDANKTFIVTLEVAPEAALLADPNLWWAALDTVLDDK